MTPILAMFLPFPVSEHLFGLGKIMKANKRKQFST